MASFDYDIGVIGGGSAGLTIASGSAQLGAKTLLIEKEHVLGGDCLHFGCVPSKTLIRSAQVYKLIKNVKQYGLPKITPEVVDFSKIAQRIRDVIGIIQKHDSVERFSSLGVDCKFGHAEFTDEHTIKLEGKTYTAKKWAIATGSSPAIPPIPGLSDVDYITNKNIFSLNQLPESMIVLGAGPIGMEMAQAFSILGTTVYVIARKNQILSKEDKDMADELAGEMQRDGVIFHYNSTIVRVNQSGNQKQVVIEKNGSQSTLSCDTLLVALGRTANTQGFGLEKAGIVLHKHGIQVDTHLRTSQKHIFAAGDVIGNHLFTHAAGYEGGVVLTNAVMHLPRKVNYTWMPWCTYCDPELANIGINEKRAAEANIRYSVWKESFIENDRSLAEGCHHGMIKLILNEKEKPLGVQILGPEAGELISEWIAILNGNVKLSTIAGAIHPYPTLGEINKKVIGSLFAKKLFSDKVRKILKTLFRYQD